MLKINDSLSIPFQEIEVSAIRSRGAGGQNVNKVSTAIHIRFDVRASTALSDHDKRRVLRLRDQRISKEGVIVIKAQRFRSQDKNRSDALEKLAEMIRKALVEKKPRKPTKATKKSREKRLDEKTKRGRLKELRGKVSE
uniref:Protein chain release factor B n=1 Tax=uncultured marine microorganism TaxID=415540 RepID=A5CFS6_9ZZZZ|nr:protein chain release factor B [uncultured marine microorganism]